MRSWEWQISDHRDHIFGGKDTPSATEVLALGKRHSPDQIAVALRQVEAGAPTAEIVRKLGFHEDASDTASKRP